MCYYYCLYDDVLGTGALVLSHHDLGAAIKLRPLGLHSRHLCLLIVLHSGKLF